MTRKELLAMVAFLTHFRPYLLGRHFTLRTDHAALSWLLTLKDPHGQLARWLERIQDYDFTVMHRKGMHHTDADALSRIPTEPPVGSIVLTHHNLSEVEEGQHNDVNIGQPIERR